ncbi:MAG: hypothetical protein PUG60_15650 [Lachnospiraceae bacterium]|nr:hypothetical protein [Lachnospiraceae bacterium]
MAIDERVERRLGDDDILDLGMLIHDFFRGLKKFWWLVVVLAVLTPAAVLAYSYITYEPMYQSQASFTVSTSDSAGVNYDYWFYYDKSTAAQMATTFPYILESDLLTDLVKQDLGTDVINGSISASAVSNSNLFTFTVTSRDPEDALAILESVIANYPEVSRYVIGDIKLNMIEEPVLPDKPYNAVQYKKRGAKGFLMGIALGFCLIGLYALTRKTIRKEEEIQNVLNVQCLGIVPQVVFKKRNRQNSQKLSIFNPRTGDFFRESIRGMALRLDQQMLDKSQKVVMVTGTLSGEGVSVISENLAGALAEMDKKTVLIDMETGFWRLKDTGAAETAGTETGILAEPGNLKKLVDELRGRFDYIVIDTPPCSCMSEASKAAECSDTLVYVIRQDYAKTHQISDGLEDICSYGVSLAGCVLNQTQVGGLSGYGYGSYGRYYGGYAYGRYGYGRYSYGRYGYGRSKSGYYGYAQSSPDENRQTDNRQTDKKGAER